jgi:outer membrane protein assembly factor BamC
MTYRSQRAEPARSILALGGAAVAALVGLSACTTFSSDKIDYKTVERAKPLDIPPDLSQLPRDERNTVPASGAVTASSVTASSGAGQPGAAAAGAGVANLVAPTFPSARIERAGNQRWLAVDAPPERAFAVVKEFFPTVGLGIEREEPSLGIIETVWAENRAKLPQDIIRRTIGRVLEALYATGEQDKFRVRVERTPNNTSEIYLTHRGMIEVYTVVTRDQTVWQPRPADAQLEVEMLQRLLLRFAPAPAAVAGAKPGATPSAGTAGATPAGAPAASQTVRLVRGDDGKGQRVDIAEPFDRAWRRVGLALDRGGFTVEDRDRAKGTYFVRYLDPEFEAKQRDKQGFFSKIFGRELKLETQQFRVAVAGAGNETQVTVLDKDGKLAVDATGQKILAQLNEQLR